MRMLLVPTLALAVLASTLPSAHAHEEALLHARYQVTLGWLHEPPALDSANAIFLKIEDMKEAHGDGHDGHAHGGHSHGQRTLTKPGTTYSVPEGEPVPRATLNVSADPKGGYTVHVATTDFTFAPHNASLHHQPGEGHAHLYVDGEKVARLYGPWHHLEALSGGEHTIRVELNTNDHRVYTVKGKPVEASATVSVPDTEGHGAIFQSPDLDPGKSFEFAPGDILSGLTIPFHDHYQHASMGTLRVHMEATNASRVEIKIKDDGFHPNNVSVRPGTTLVFLNEKTGAGDAAPFAAVVSGLLSAHAHAGAPVENAHKTLTLVVSVGEHERNFTLAPLPGAKGQYVARFVPTMAGDHTVRLVGTIGGKAIDHRTKIEAVRPATEEQWPTTGPSTSAAVVQLAEKTRELAEKDAQLAQKQQEVDALAAEAARTVPGSTAPLAAFGVAFAALLLAARRRAR